jgi:uncharacterized protein (DUF58 family)
MRIGSAEVNLTAFGFYLFILIPAFLANAAFGGIFTALMFALLSFVIFSLVHLFVSYSNVKVLQEFNNDHPKKGEEIGFEFQIAMEGLIPTCRVEWEYEFQRPDWGDKREVTALWLMPKEKQDDYRKLECPFRGTYTMGLDRLILEDILGWVKLYPRVFKKTFYVYPRLVHLDHNRWLPGWEKQNSSGAHATLEDPLVFESLREYRQGESLKFVDWKKFAVTGSPIIRKFEPESYDGIKLFLDMNREEKLCAPVLSREDLSVESALALVNYFLNLQVPTEVTAKTKHREFYFRGSQVKDIQTFWNRTKELEFESSPILTHSYQEEFRRHAGKVVVITHRMDGALLELAKIHPQGLFLINNASLEEEELRKRQLRANELRKQGVALLMFRSLPEFQEGWKWLSS